MAFLKINSNGFLPVLKEEGKGFLPEILISSVVEVYTIEVIKAKDAKHTFKLVARLSNGSRYDLFESKKEDDVKKAMEELQKYVAKR